MFESIEGSIFKDEVIQGFCGGCSHLQPDLSCAIETNAKREPRLVGQEVNYIKVCTNQERAILKDWCGGALKDGVRGIKTSDSFEPLPAEMQS